MTWFLAILYDSKFRFLEGEVVPDVIGIFHSLASLRSADEIICLQLQALSSHISHVAEHLLILGLRDSSSEASKGL